MAFVRKRGNSYYLVHSVRKNGRVAQLHLARLGTRPRISDDVIEGVKSNHPQVRVDWEGVREKASRFLVKPFESDARYYHDVLSAIRALHQEIADLHLPVLELTHDHELFWQLTAGLQLLRATLDVKLGRGLKGKTGPRRAGERFPA